MRRTGLAICSTLLGVTMTGPVALADRIPLEDRPAYQQAGYEVMAVVANFVPFVSAIYAPKCLPGYIVCKLGFAGFNTLAAGAQLITSGGADLEQTKAILERGYGGDWILTSEDIAGDRTPQPYPDPAPPATKSTFTPPPQ